MTPEPGTMAAMTTFHSTVSTPRPSSAIGAMAMCVALLIAAEFMPVSLLTPIAADLGATQGMAGQAISISGLFAVVTSLLIPGIASRFDRRHVLIALTAILLASLVLIAAAPNFAVFMAARGLLGITVGGFWALSTSTIMRMVPQEGVARALGTLYMGNAVAAALAAPAGSYLGALIGWRGVFWGMAPIVALNLAWQWLSLPSIRVPGARPVGASIGLLKRRQVAVPMAAVMLTFAGAFAVFTYLRPFLETYTRVTTQQLSLLLLCLGGAGFIGTYGASALAGRHLHRLMRGLPLALAAVTLAMLACGHLFWATALLLMAWGAVNSAIPVCWSTWLATGIADDPDSGGGLMVAAIQLAIMLGGALGGLLLDRLSMAATMSGGALLLVVAFLAMGALKRSAPAS